MLIYEYMSNKNLNFFIFDPTRSSSLNWSKHFEIIIGIARGILYLHHDSRLRIIHRDLKTSNILLDDEMNSKISNFGLARIFKGDQIQDRTDRVVETYGYISPEYAVFGRFLIKSDVFSFGVILSEIISVKKNSGSYFEHPLLNLIRHVWELWKEDRALDIVDSSINESYVPHEVLGSIQIGLLCVQEDVRDRKFVGSSAYVGLKKIDFVVHRKIQLIDFAGVIIPPDLIQQGVKECMTTDDQDEKITLAALLERVWPRSQFMAELARKTLVALREFMDQVDNFINAMNTL
ncbi:cysteine-rich receptor-like protein kinase 15 [Juglans microcarpa x Juglans regia]|uniref:cysteine-rich receptor-like protein kinase 15 n=1 Tax=Juglans microcarpa x Juglans regia TaxID=2249226 RepID=UPI001B7E14A8|nr:cysteine-rich receptor-like protein kinase 15 [Juglans microcarpa x Juglans regia]